MRVDGAHHGFHRGLGLHGGYRFGNQLESIRPDNVDAQDLAELLVRHHLDESFVMAQDGGAAVARERELADLDLQPLGARLRFRHPHTADTRLSVGGVGNAIAIDRRGGFARHVRDRDHALARGYVRQLRSAKDNVADGIDARLGGLLVRIHFDEPALQLDARILDADLLRIRLTPDGHEQLFNFKLFSLAVGEHRRKFYTRACLAHVFHARAGLDPDAGLFEIALEFFRYFFVFERDGPRQHLENRDFRAEAAEDRTEFHAHRARADDGQRFRHGIEIQDLDVGQDELGIGFESRHHARFRSRGDDDVPGFERLRLAVRQDVDTALSLQRGK